MLIGCWLVFVIRCPIFILFSSGFIHFFNRLAHAGAPPPGDLVLSRAVLDDAQRSEAWWSSCDREVLPAKVVREGGIDQADPATHLYIDFANAYIGGGVLSGGCVQEEILFAVAPLHTVSLLFCPAMEDYEAITIQGAEHFSEHCGYAFSLEYAGDKQDTTQRDAAGATVVKTVAIDAISYRHGGSEQYKSQHMLRDVVKAFTGFSVPGHHTGVSTGNWGCGAFGGDLHFKSILQWIAASAAGRHMEYHSFGEGGDMAAELTQLSIDAAEARLTCSALWCALKLYRAEFFRAQKAREDVPNPRAFLRGLLL